MRDWLDTYSPDGRRVVGLLIAVTLERSGDRQTAIETYESPAERVRLALDNLNTHSVAEVQLRALTKPSLKRRIPDMANLRRQTQACTPQRNARQKGVHWQLRTPHARIRLNRLYPQIQY